MDTGRISLPSISCMLNTKSQLNYLQTPSPPPPPPLLTSEANISSFSQHDQQDQQPKDLFVHSSSSTSWKSHVRSHSLDVNLAYSTLPSFPQQQQQQQQPSSSFAGLPLLSPTSQLGSSVPPSHERSTRMTPFIASSSSSLIQQQQQPSWTRTDNHQPPPPLPPTPPHRHHHHHDHQRSTSYTMVMNYYTGNNKTASLHKMIDDTPPRKYLCPHCTKSFSRPSSLRTHIFSHSGEKPFVCPYQGCHRTFSVQSNMRRHIRVHYSASLASSSSQSS